MADRGGRGGRGGERGGRGGGRGGRGGDRGGGGGNRGGRGGDAGWRGGDRGGRGGERGLPARGGDAGRGERGGIARGGRGIVSGNTPRGGGDPGRGGGPPPQQAARGSGGPGRGGRGFRGGPRGNQRGRGGYPAPGPVQGQEAPTQDVPEVTPVADHIRTVGVKRTEFVSVGRRIQVVANALVVSVPEGYIYLYDVAILPEQDRAMRMNMDIIRRLQEVIAPNIFNPRASYDRKKLMYSSHFLFSEDDDEDKHTFDDVTLEDVTPGGRPPRVYTVKITRAKRINTTILHEFTRGRQSGDNQNTDLHSALQALNVVSRMDPSLRYPSHSGSFFTDTETVDIRAGIELWRGYFQSIRPSIQRILINVDISTGMMYKRGPLIGTALGHLRGANLHALTPGGGLNTFKRKSLENFLNGCRVLAESAGNPNNRTKKTIKRISRQSAAQLTFDLQGQPISVADYFRQMRNGQPLQHPELPCIELSNGALVPFECCEVIPGQILRKQLPHDKTSEMVRFSTMKAPERLRSIIAGLPFLNYAQSDYLNQFGMTVDTSSLVRCPALVINPPVMRYGSGSLDPRVQPESGAWNMVEKTFWLAKPLTHWIIVSFDDQRFSPRQHLRGLIGGLIQGMESVGMEVQDQNPGFYVHSPQSNVLRVLEQDRQASRINKGTFPTLVVVILPEGGDDIYVAVKHWGDVICGIATQCLQSKKWKTANRQYWANVCLKINVKLGGINAIPESSISTWLSDPHNPTLVMGADVAHAAPGVLDRPSYAAVTGSIDSNGAKYTAIMKPQRGEAGFRREPILELESMATHIIQRYINNRQQVEKKVGTAAHPKRILFYRDGVNEGQFQEIKDTEIKALKRALDALNIKADITFIVVGKRHHLRFFPTREEDADASPKSRNLPAGTVVDQGVTHPTDMDFYLLSHPGILGTSRPAHYSVLQNDLELSADQIVNISYMLCHVYARATRSVSIPAPVYYAHIAASRAKSHYDPNQDLSTTHSESTVAGANREATLNAYYDHFIPIHPNQHDRMYFM